MLTASLLLTGLFQTATPSPAAAPDLKAMARSILARVETMRGQKLSRPLVSGVKSRAEVTRFIQERLREEYGPAQVEAEGELLTLMGLLPAGTRYGELVTRLLTEQVAGFYDHTRKALHLADWIAPELQAPVMAHEIFHAIQDQEWGGGQLIDSKAHSHDAVLAHAAVMEGDATQVMIAYAQSANAAQPQVEVDAYVLTLTAASLPASMASAEFPVMGGAPDYLKQSLVFPYQSGLVFLAALRNLGWRSADFRKLYSDPPESTEQVLHPEKYATQRDRPVRVEVDVPTGVQRPWTNTAGELHYRLMLSQRLSASFLQTLPFKASLPQFAQSRVCGHSSCAGRTRGLTLHLLLLLSIDPSYREDYLALREDVFTEVNALVVSERLKADAHLAHRVIAVQHAHVLVRDHKLELL
jgi:hypothetical protein